MIGLKRVLVNFGVLFLSLLVLMGALEVLLAVMQINQKSINRLVPGKGSTYIPGAYYRHTKEGFSEGYFNSHGFRDYDRTYEKLDAVKRPSLSRKRAGKSHFIWLGSLRIAGKCTTII